MGEAEAGDPREIQEKMHKGPVHPPETVKADDSAKKAIGDRTRDKAVENGIWSYQVGWKRFILLVNRLFNKVLGENDKCVFFLQPNKLFSQPNTYMCRNYPRFLVYIIIYMCVCVSVCVYKYILRYDGNPLHYSCLENIMDRGAWRATVHRVAKSWTQLKQLSPRAHTHTHTHIS